MKKLLYLIFSSTCLFGDTVTPEILRCCNPAIVNFGYNKFVKNAVVTFDSQKGIALFEQAQYKNAFFKLAPHYAPQQTILTCGIASGVMILNTLYADAGKTPPLSLPGSFYDCEENTVFGQFIWTEENYFTPKVSRFLDREVVEGRKKLSGQFVPGVSLNQLGKSLKLHDLDLSIHHVNSAKQEDIDAFRDLVKSVTKKPSRYLIVNYSLTLYLKEGGGHFSPLAAYDQESDKVLILDTWSASNVWVWVQLEDLYRSMHTKDGSTYRGYLIIKGFS